MICLKKLPFIDDFNSMQSIVSLDSLANLKKHLAALNSWVPSHYRKADYVMVINAMFQTYPLRLVDALPDKEYKLVSALLDKKADEYLTCPRKEGKELLMQTLYLVVSYEDGKRWRLYMPECIRRELKRGYVKRMDQIMKELSELR